MNIAKLFAASTEPLEGVTLFVALGTESLTENVEIARHWIDGKPS
jgi:hypothetical protein